MSTQSTYNNTNSTVLVKVEGFYDCIDYLLIKKIMKLPSSDLNEVLVVRVNKATKQKLEQLAKKNKYGKNSCDVVRTLIDSAYSRRF